MSMTGNNSPRAIIATGIKSRDGTKENFVFPVYSAADLKNLSQTVFRGLKVEAAASSFHSRSSSLLTRGGVWMETET